MTYPGAPLKKQRQSKEMTLRSQEEKYRMLAESSLTGIFIHQDGQFVFVNERFAEIHGYTSQELLGKDHVTLICPEEREALARRAQKRLRGEPVPQRYEVQRLRKDGQVVWCEMLATRIQYEGRPAIMGNMIEINERVQAREALRESEKRLKILFEFAPDGYYLNDLKGNFVDGNRAAEQLIGYSREELIGRSFLRLRLLPPEELPKAAAALVKNALGKATGPEKFTLIRKDGSTLPVEIRTFPVKLRGKTLVLGIARDISERKKAEEAFKESEQRFRELAKLLPVIVCEMDGNLRLTYVNDLGFQTFGFTQDELDAGICAMDLIHPDEREKAASRIEKPAKGADFGPLEHRMLRKDGSEISALVNGVAIRKNGQIKGYRMSITEITELKQLQARLQRAQTMEAIATLAGGVAP